MAGDRVPADTARRNRASSSRREPPESENTLDLGDTSASDPVSACDDVAQRYAEGVIRFYRARAILDECDGDEACRLAWSHLQALEPQHVAPPARAAFFSLAYLMLVQAQNGDFDAAAFRAYVNDIGSVLDGFLNQVREAER